jgi:hypothetical protein
MSKKIILIIIAIIILGGIGYFYYQSTRVKSSIITPEKNFTVDPQNATYQISSKEITLVNGKAETEMATGSTGKIITQYFGNEVKADLNGDGKEDVAFLLTQDSGGSGIFFYAAAVLGNGEKGIGTKAVFIGDRIAPQNTEFKNGMIIANFAERQPGEPFSAAPSVGVSKYFKIVDSELREVTLKIGEAEARAIAEKSCIKGGEALAAGTYNENTKTWWFDANLNATREGCNPACVVSEETKQAEINWRCTGLVEPK